DKPFALISISADDKKEELQEFLEKEKMPWTHWWEGRRESGIIYDWNVQFFPTIYVIDAKGVIATRVFAARNSKKRSINSSTRRSAWPHLKRCDQCFSIAPAGRMNWQDSLTSRQCPTVGLNSAPPVPSIRSKRCEPSSNSFLQVTSMGCHRFRAGQLDCSATI